MKYVAILNFKIGREITKVGDEYVGGQAKELLAQGLIKEVVVDEQQAPVAEESLVPEAVEPVLEEPKKGKKKKG